MSTRASVTAIGRDPDALEDFYREHLHAVQVYVARRVSSAEDAADLTADVFVRAIDASARYRGDGASALAWLYGIARHVVADHHRSTARAERAHRRIQGRDLLDEDATERIAARIDDQRHAREVLSLHSPVPEVTP